MRYGGSEEESEITHEQVHRSVLPQGHASWVQLRGRRRRRGHFSLSAYFRGRWDYQSGNTTRCEEHLRGLREVRPQVHWDQTSVHWDLARLAQEWRRWQVCSLCEEVPGVWLQVGDGGSRRRIHQNQAQHSSQRSDPIRRVTFSQLYP